MDRRRGPPPSSFSSEQFRIDEVRYLHSLWYQGPPPNPNPNYNNNNLRPSNPPIFKKNKKRGRSRNRHNRNEEVETETMEPVSEVEWPTDLIPEPREEIRWPDSVPQPDSSLTTVFSAEEEEKYKGVQSQNKAVKASKHFLSTNFGSDSEAVVDEDEDFMEDDDDGDDKDGEDSEEFNFFLNLFTEDGELRNYYDKNWEGGDFPCFVCGVSGRKCGKRFKNCVSLVHHSTSISSRKRRRAHRAFGQVLCRVMGWEFKRLPSIVLSAGGPLSVILAQAGSSQVTDDENNNKVVDSVNADIVGGDQEKELNVNCGGDANGNSAECEMGIKKNYANDQQKEVLNDKTINYAANVNGTSANHEGGTKENDANDQPNEVDKGNVDTVGANSGEPIDSNLNSRKDDVAQQDQNLQKKIVDSGGEVSEEIVSKSGAGHGKQDFQNKVVNSVDKGNE